MRPVAHGCATACWAESHTSVDVLRNRSRSLGLVTLCYAIVLPGRKSAFRAGFWPDCYLEITEFGPPAGLWLVLAR